MTKREVPKLSNGFRETVEGKKKARHLYTHFQHQLEHTLLLTYAATSPAPCGIPPKRPLSHAVPHGQFFNAC